MTADSHLCWSFAGARPGSPGEVSLLATTRPKRRLSLRLCTGPLIKMIEARGIATAFMSLLLTASACCAQEVQSENIPNEILMPVEQGRFATLDALEGSINPFYLRGDFDGDGRPDYAVRIKSKTGSELGIAIWLSSLHKFIVLGAGVPFRVSGTTVKSLDFLNTWQVFSNRAVERGVESGPPPQLKGDAIWAGKAESA